MIVALPFAINLVANLILTPIQFGLRNLPLAAVDILVVWATIIWMIVDGSSFRLKALLLMKYCCCGTNRFAEETVENPIG